MAQVIFRTPAVAVDSTIIGTSAVRQANLITGVGKADTKERTDRWALSNSERTLDSLLATTVDDIVENPAQLARASSRSTTEWLSIIPSIPPIRLISPGDYRISSRFGWRVHPIKNKTQVHTGIDLPYPTGTPVYSTADGIITRIVWDRDGLGLAVYIKHPSNYVSIYGHLSICTVRQGDYVKRGTNIGRVGSTGNSTGPHLHYAVLHNQKPVNPERFCLLWLKKLNAHLTN